MKNAVISGFTLLHSIGEGGMAEVWYAENSIGKKAAVKIIRKELSLLPEIVSRFQNEAKVMVTLDHPNIRQVYDYSVIDGRPCIIMEYLEGADLSVRLKKGERFSNDQLTNWWNQLAEALNYTHAKEVVHRDIKPSNIFLTNDGKIKLLDFGIAKVKGGLTTTQTGTRMGTLMYMSPEQVKDSKNVDHRTDLYSMAVTFFHLLAGTAPYENTKSSEFEIQVKIVNEPLALERIPVAWNHFLKPYLIKESQLRPQLKPFSGNPQLQPQHRPSTKTQVSAETEIRRPRPATPKSFTPTPAPKSGSNKTLYWLLAAAAVIILVLVVNYLNDPIEKAKQAEQQRIEQAERTRQEEERKKKEEQNLQAEARQQADQNAWNTARNTNTKASYEKYLRDYPHGKYVSDARARINEIDGNEAERNRQEADQNAWNTAKNSNTKASYQKYLSDYPQGKFVSDARSRINEIDGNEAEVNRQQADQNAWNTAKNSNSKASYQKYLSDYPQGKYVSDARTKITEIDKTEAERNRQQSTFGTFTDPRDGKTYKTVRIGNQTWMAENLNYVTSSGSWCYDNRSINCTNYGRLYDWETAKKACPPGWHLPTDNEWTQLTNFLGGENVAGGKLKSTTGWDNPNTGATNSSGFLGLPGGYRSMDGVFPHQGGVGYCWSSSQIDASNAWYRKLHYYEAVVYRDNLNKLLGFSVRCLRD